MIPRKKLRKYDAHRLASAPTIHGLSWDDNLVGVQEACAELERRIQEDSPYRAQMARAALVWLRENAIDAR